MELTPDRIVDLKPGEVFVFGSNADGAHGAGAAKLAHDRFGAVWGEGRGHHGDSYGIDTMSGPEVLAAEAKKFLEYAASHPDLTFLLTPVGCGIAGYTPEEVAPHFAGAPANVTMPRSFVRYLRDADA